MKILSLERLQSHSQPHTLGVVGVTLSLDEFSSLQLTIFTNSTLDFLGRYTEIQLNYSSLTDF